MGYDKVEYGGLFQQISSHKGYNLAKLPNGIESLYTSGWDQVACSNQDGNFVGTTSAVIHKNHSFSALLENQTGPGGESCSDMVPSFGANPSQGPENGAINKGKRKTSEEEDDRKNCPSPASQGKYAADSKIVKGNAKENYVHVRAKRGQATNSHSLAERVRRERISERMKMLQDLVPGCNKITGKAVMLDEIINYVQSLQQQVEFLSMKLATVNSELSMDIDLARLFPNEVFHSQGNDAAVLGVHPETSFLQSFHGFPQPNMNSFTGAIPQYHRLAPNLWNNEPENIHRTTQNDSNL